MKKLFRLFALGLLVGIFGFLGWASFASIQPGSKEEVFVIPKGTWARRMAGNKVDIMPATIDLVLGLRDVLVFKNLDDVPQMFGPTLIMPNQSFKLPFEVASEYLFECTAHTSGQMKVIVHEYPSTARERLEWRIQELSKSLGSLFGKRIENGKN